MISVVMATYNGEKYIVEQLDSIKNQTVKPDEVIICDDGSKDSTEEIVRKYISDNGLDGWKFSVNEKNLGYADNFQQVAKRASGDFIFFSDQDDLWELDKIEQMLDIMNAHEDCKLLCTDYEPFASDENAPTPPQKILDQMPNNGVLENVGLSKKSVYIRALGCCMCVRKTFFDEIESYWFDGWAQDDRMWKMAQCAHGNYLLHKNLVKHRLHGNNTATYGKYHTVDKRLKLFKEMLAANKEMLRYLNDVGASSHDKKVVRNHVGMMQGRVNALSSKNMFKLIPMIKFLPYYEKLKSYLVDYVIIMNDKKA